MAQPLSFSKVLKPGFIVFGALAIAVPATAYVGGYLTGKTVPQPPAEVDAQIEPAALVNADVRWEAANDPQPPSPITRTVAVEKGDNLMGVLTRAGAEPNAAYAAIQSLGKTYDPRRDLSVGDELEITFGPGGAAASRDSGDAPSYVLSHLNLPLTYNRRVEVRLNDDGGFVAKEVERSLEQETVTAAGTIDNSLFVDASAAGIPPTVLAELIRIFSFDVDFQRDIWPGDKFELMYEQYRDDKGEVVHEGNIQYAKLTLRNTELPLYRYTTSAGTLDYFNTKGQSVRKTLMRTPIDGARLSSPFGKRRHPILGYTRMHKGVDFAAPTGTPIYAAGDGTVVKVGRNGGYGNYIRLRHNSTYQTAYAHMSRFARSMHSGTRVRQGQIIGYVGTTGRSTGPHLHYEVIRSGRQINPRSVRIPSGEKLAGAELKKFTAVRDRLDAQYAQLRDTASRVAENAAKQQH